MKKFLLILLLLGAIGAAAGFYYTRSATPEPKIDTTGVTRGAVAQTVPATGTLEAVTTVDVGTQVSGIVQELYVDFNDIVRKGQVIAKLDPTLIQTQIEQQKANVIRAEADLERLKVGLADSQRKFDQAQKMFEKNLVPRNDLEAAELAVKNAEVQIRSSQAGLTQANANLNTQEVNLAHTIIHSPIDGIVISRNVDPGQTVQSSMSAPTLYVIAEDLHQMQVIANIDEADVGRMRPNQPVSFTVDAYPREEFRGTVSQVRLQPTVVQNVVVYATVIAVPNPQLKLKPGMTATVTIEVARKDNVLRVPNVALRFRPTQEMFAVLKQPVPPEIQMAAAGGRGGAGGPGGPGGPQGGRGRGDRAPGGGSQPGAAPGAQPGPTAPPAAGAAPTPPGQKPESPNGPRTQAQESRGGGDRAEGGGRERGGRGSDANMTPEEREARRKRMEERLKNMTPEERARFEERMRQGGGGRGGDSGGRGNAQNAPRNAQASGRGGDSGRGMVGRINPGDAIASGATTIDSLFGALPVVDLPGRVWILTPERTLKSVRLRVGIDDGSVTEVISGDLKEGDQVVTNFLTGLEPVVRPGQTPQGQNPFTQPQRGGDRGRGGGGPGGGGGGGNRGR
jgi:HlyD family secretion protein